MSTPQTAVAAKVNPERQGQVALRAFFNITDAWGCSATEQQHLLGVAKSTYALYRKLPEVRLRRETLERISYVLGIQKALQLLLPNAEQVRAWPRKPNSAAPFNGQSALQRMLGGSVADLAQVRRYLDAQRG